MLKHAMYVTRKLHYNTAACRTSTTAEHLLLAAPIFIPSEPFRTRSQVSSCFYVFSVQVGYNPPPKGPFISAKRVAKLFSLPSCQKEKLPSGRE